MAKAAPLDTTIEVVTPENIAFRYQLAGPFRRLPAFLLDFAIKITIFVAAIFLLGLIVGTTGNQLLFVFGFAALNIGWFFLYWFYGVAQETVFNGRTIGKWALGIRVVGVTGHPINGMQAALRNLVVVADLAPAASLQFFYEDFPAVYLIPTGVFGLVAMVFTRRMQRLGDLSAGTMVVIDERGWSLPISQVDDKRVPALASYIPPDYRISPSMAKILAVYAQRRTYLSPARRRELAKHLTDPLIELFEFREDIDPDLLLYALYWKAYLADTREEEPDLGPLAGFSPLLRDAAQPTESPDSPALGVGVSEPVERITSAPQINTPAGSQASPTSGEHDQ